ncbi:hypothetical protein HAX54_004659 [Datura stramonium]|uniref:Uncharacterized protein n=1 Tax=Datura stramonium TaxID=4076 RepID=A0ABS8T9Q0_DATST|nr:hypothetical protein [Datura stramonium]
MAQMASAHEAQLARLSKAIPPMIQQAIKMAMKLMINKLGSLCAQVDVLQNEAVSLWEKVNRRREILLPMDFDLNIPPAGQDPPMVDSNPRMTSAWEASHLEDPYRVAPIYSYHEARTLPDRWIVATLGEPLALPPNLLMPSVMDIASQYFL